MSGLSLRPVGPGDRDRLVGLARAFHAEDGHPLDDGGEAALAALCAGEPFGRGWLAEADGAVVGYVVLSLGFSVEFGGRDGFVDDLYLVPPARGRGLGGALLERLVDEAQALGVRTLHLEVEPDNGRAEALYARHGFARSPRRLMSRRLG
ncbi:MAG: GNAT family N-acetyltransferase [Geminicoccaceae bacterium]